MEAGGQHHTCHFTLGESPQYPLNRRLDGSFSWSGCGGKEKKYLALDGNQTLIIQLIVSN